MFSKVHTSFSPDELSVLQTAFDGACHELGLEPGDADPDRTVLAEAIMAAAQSGERNPQALMNAAVLELGRRRLGTRQPN